MTTQAELDFEKEKFDHHRSIQEKELELENRKLDLADRELRFKLEQDAKTRWRNPLVIAILAAAVAALGNLVIAIINGHQDRLTESKKSEQLRILEMVKTSDVDQAAANLQFLVDVGLVSDSRVIISLRQFLSEREPGKGPVLPANSGKTDENLRSVESFVATEAIGSVMRVRRTVAHEPGDVMLQANCRTIFLKGEVDDFLASLGKDSPFVTLTAPNGAQVIINKRLISKILPLEETGPRSHTKSKAFAG